MIGEERVGRKRIKALLVRKIAERQWREDWSDGGRVQHALKNGRAIQVGRRVETAAARCWSWSGEQTASGRCPTRGKELNRAATIGGHRVEGHGQERMIVEEAITHANDGSTVATWIPRKSEPRRKIIVVAGNSLHHTQRFLRGGIHGSGCSEERGNFDVIPHTVIQGEPAIDAPGILGKEAEWQIIKRLIGITDSLNVSGRDSESVGLQASSAGQSIWKSKSGSSKAAEIHVATKIEFENLRFCGAQLNYDCVNADFECVASERFRECVREFQAPLDAVNRGVWLTPKISNSGDIDADLIAAGELRKAEMQAAACILKPKSVNRGWTGYGVMLKSYIQIARLVVACARTRILAEHLVLGSGRQASDERG